jgi:KDO2-lipid IV(A) lauroyltransferase
MKLRSGPLAWMAYALIRVAMSLAQVFPIDANLRFARTLARWWVRLTPRHRDRAILHLEQSYGGTLDRGRIEAIADGCLAHWAMFALELACAPRLLSPMSWPRYIEPVDFEETLGVLLDGRGVILVSGHYGNFEVTGYMLANLGLEVVAVMRPLDNVYLNRYVVSSRRSHGLRLLDKKGAMLHAEEVLQRGAALAFVADQNAGRKGVFVDFFGRPASTYKSVGLLAMTTGCPIVVGYARRVGGRFRYRVGVRRIIRPREWESQEHPLRWITQAYTTALEEIIREAPEQYLWIHRRWKSQPRAAPSRGAAAVPVS